MLEETLRFGGSRQVFTSLFLSPRVADEAISLVRVESKANTSQ
jgi:hypothetical protein